MAALSCSLVIECTCRQIALLLLFIIIIITYLLRPKAAQHNITVTKTEEKTQETKN